NLSMRALLPSGGAPISTANGGGLGERLNSLRDGFLGSRGRTNFGVRHAQGSKRRVTDMAEDLATGLAVTFVPISALKLSGVIAFEGGRGLLMVTDADTLFIDLTLLAICVVLFQAGAVSRGDVASLVFVI